MGTHALAARENWHRWILDETVSQGSGREIAWPWSAAGATGSEAALSLPHTRSTTARVCLRWQQAHGQVRRTMSQNGGRGSFLTHGVNSAVDADNVLSNERLLQTSAVSKVFTPNG
jgi:hypothetical protein